MKLAIKIDVDTLRGTRLGVPNLLDLFQQHDIKATFLFSMGPDNTGRAVKRIFRPGFLKKVSRTSVIQVYGFRTLLNGLFWPGPHIGRSQGHVMKSTLSRGHEVGIHCYDHIRWQDHLHTLSYDQVLEEVKKACDAFESVFSEPSKTMGAAGWQANDNSLKAYDEMGLRYASDTRGTSAFYPVINGIAYKTLQLPTTLPTLDELIGRPEYPLNSLTDHYCNLLNPDGLNILTIHAELEGMAYLDWFTNFLDHLRRNNIEIVTAAELAEEILAHAETIPYHEVIQKEIDGRSGTLACQGSFVDLKKI